MLGFGSDSTARRLISLHKDTDQNRALAHDIDESTATQLSRKVWGNKRVIRPEKGPFRLVSRT